MNTIYNSNIKENPLIYQPPKTRGYLFPTTKKPLNSVKTNKLSFKSYLDHHYYDNQSGFRVDQRTPVSVLTETILMTFFNGKGLPKQQELQREKQKVVDVKQKIVDVEQAMRAEQTHGLQFDQIF